MFRRIGFLSGTVAALAVGYLASNNTRAATRAAASSLAAPSGNYVESRTCDVYTGPCFANAQVGLAGHQALMAWNIEQGSFEGVDLAGLNVVMALHASDTLGIGGGLVVQPEPIESVVLVDERADDAQRDALLEFAKKQAGRMAGDVVRVAALPIDFEVDHSAGVTHLKAGKEARLTTRKLKQCDCVCTNESNFYPPLTEVKKPASAFTVDGGFSGRGLREHWSNPGTRSAFLAKFGD